MTLSEFLSNQNMVADYKKWIDTDIGIIVCSVLQETYCRPRRPDADKINGSTAEYCLGVQDGAWTMLDALRDLAGQGQNLPDMPDADYGASEESTTKES